jgi:hypothetical protein
MFVFYDEKHDIFNEDFFACSNKKRACSNEGFCSHTSSLTVHARIGFEENVYRLMMARTKPR